jgi:hypothetical protein
VLAECVQAIPSVNSAAGVALRLRSDADVCRPRGRATSQKLQLSSTAKVSARLKRHDDPLDVVTSLVISLGCLLLPVLQ